MAASIAEKNGETKVSWAEVKIHPIEYVFEILIPEEDRRTFFPSEKKPILWAASITFAAVLSPALRVASLFNIRDTVEIENPVSLAISFNFTALKTSYLLFPTMEYMFFL